MSMCDLLRSLFRHSLHLITFAENLAGCTLEGLFEIANTSPRGWLALDIL